MNPVGRKESLDALHEAQELQAVLRELLVWAQRLRAQLDSRRSPGSLAEVQCMLEEHQELKVSSPDLGAFPGSHLLSGLLPLIVTTILSWVLSVSAASAFPPVHPAPSVVFPTSPPSPWPSSLPLREPQPLGSEPSPLTGRAGLPNRQHQPGPKHWAATACCRAPIHPQHPPGPGWF